MAWQQPAGGSGRGRGSGGYNPTAQPFFPGGAGGFQPQQGGYGYQPQQQGGYGYQPQQQGGYGYQPQGQPYYPQGGYQPQGQYQPQAGYQPQEPYQGQQQYQQPQGGFQQPYGFNPHQQPVPAPEPAPAPVEEPKPSASALSKLQLGGSKTSEPIVMPKKAKGAKLVLGAKAEEPKPKEPDTPTSRSEPGAAAAATSEEDSKVADDQKDRNGGPSSMSATERREKVRQEVLKKKRSQKEYVRDPRPHFNVIFCGHVDAGKSTISGHLLADNGLVDQREMEKLKREAEQNHREGWEYAYVMDVSEEERSRGKTHETGAAYFETKERRITVLDAPGHKAFVPSMIGGATQADIVVLVISSRTGEFETGFEKGGQTREHALLVRTCGVKQMICVVNKMDDMNWSQERYNEIVNKMRPFLKSNGYDEKNNTLTFIPVSGLKGTNLMPENTSRDVCSWYQGPTVMEYINSLTLPETKGEDDQLCVPLAGAYKDDGKVYVYGKCESGSVVVGDKITILPTKLEAVIDGITIEGTELEKCYPGDNVHLRVRGFNEDDVHPGYVATGSATESSLRAVDFFQARIQILEVKNILSAGSRVMMHIHEAQEEVTIDKIFAKVDRRTNEITEKDPPFAKAGDVIIARIAVERSLVVECHKDFDKMGRFMFRDEGRTIAIGLVTKLYESTRNNIVKKQ